MLTRRRALGLALAAPVALPVAVAAAPASGGFIVAETIEGTVPVGPDFKMLRAYSETIRTPWGCNTRWVDGYATELKAADFSMHVEIVHSAHDDTIPMSDVDLAATLGIPAGEAPHG